MRAHQPHSVFAIGDSLFSKGKGHEYCRGFGLSCYCHRCECSIIDYCFCSETTMVPGIWMSFFDTEEVHAVMPDKVADEGGLPWRDDTGI